MIFFLIFFFTYVPSSRVGGNKAHLPAAYNLVTGSVWVGLVKRKAGIGGGWGKVVTVGPPHLRPHKVTAVTGKCRAVHGILAGRAPKHGMGHLPTTPH